VAAGTGFEYEQLAIDEVVAVLEVVAGAVVLPRWERSKS